MKWPKPSHEHRILALSLALFCAATVGFVWSVQQLLAPDTSATAHDHRPPQETEETRRKLAALAESKPSTGVLDLQCLYPGKRTVTAPVPSVRLSGRLCHGRVKSARGTFSIGPHELPVITFIDNASGKFTTDYFQLGSGQTELQLEFESASGKTWSAAVTIKSP